MDLFENHKQLLVNFFKQSGICVNTEIRFINIDGLNEPVMSLSEKLMANGLTFDFVESLLPDGFLLLKDDDEELTQDESYLPEYMSDIVMPTPLYQISRYLSSL